ncbi:hypothetical protein U0070_004069, partial [Myodes glareolus]
MHSKENIVLTRTPQTKDTKRKGMRDKLGADSRDTGCGMSRGGPVRSNLMGICGRETGEERKSPAGPRVHPAGTQGASRRTPGTPGCVPQDSRVRPAGPQGASRRIPGCVQQDPRVHPAGSRGASSRTPGYVAVLTTSPCSADLYTPDTISLWRSKNNASSAISRRCLQR